MPKVPLPKLSLHQGKRTMQTHLYHVSDSKMALWKILHQTEGILIKIKRNSCCSSAIGKELWMQR